MAAARVPPSSGIFGDNGFPSFCLVFSSWKVGPLDDRHILIQLLSEEDYARIFAMRFMRFDDIFMKILKWSVDFDAKVELPIISVWLRLLCLKVHLFNHEILFSIAAMFGKPLKLYAPTFNLSGPSMARILIERDVTLPPPEEVWIGSAHNSYWQQVHLEQHPRYCGHCRMFGHDSVQCFHLHLELRNRNGGQNQHKLSVEKAPTTSLLAECVEPTVVPIVGVLNVRGVDTTVTSTDLIMKDVGDGPRPLEDSRADDTFTINDIYAPLENEFHGCLGSSVHMDATVETRSLHGNIHAIDAINLVSTPSNTSGSGPQGCEGTIVPDNVVDVGVVSNLLGEE
ncbi:uncharacterized protein LOC110032584 [Phalaenopsis equestris]|uniref:uncharacterized protein LOC110032584 n=1 Tax=Phalaenopsis equestris TaxID=78828 RepID=UPI0009E20357|nr:uncharacterized protein LOC110032584 [Phalaenopsis equestris]